MQFDKKLYPHTLISLAMILVFLLLERVSVPLYDGFVVDFIESLQSVWLLFGALFTWMYIRKAPISEQKRAFWLWSIVWWVTLFGRGISWGRDYFPEGPKVIFRTISVVLIGAIVLLLFMPNILHELSSKLKSGTFPMWDCVLTVVCFMIADTVEHHRYFAFIFLQDRAYQDLMEELYETPFMLSLFYVAYYLMKRDKSLSISTNADGMC